MVPEPRRSLSSRAAVLEPLNRGLAPAAIVLGAVDAIIGLGILVGIKAFETRCSPMISGAGTRYPGANAKLRLAGLRGFPAHRAALDGDLHKAIAVEA